MLLNPSWATFELQERHGETGRREAAWPSDPCGRAGLPRSAPNTMNRRHHSQAAFAMKPYEPRLAQWSGLRQGHGVIMSELGFEDLLDPLVFEYVNVLASRTLGFCDLTWRCLRHAVRRVLAARQPKVAFYLHSQSFWTPTEGLPCHVVCRSSKPWQCQPALGAAPERC